MEMLILAGCSARDTAAAAPAKSPLEMIGIVSIAAEVVAGSDRRGLPDREKSRL